MKSTFILILVCLTAFTQAKTFSLEEINNNKFGKTLLDTIQLQLMNLDVQDGQLTGPVKVIYDMLLELSGSLQGEQDDDQEGLDALCEECTRVTTDYTNKLAALKVQMVLDVQELTSLQASMEALEATHTAAQQESERVGAILSVFTDAYNAQDGAIDALIQEAALVNQALVEARAFIASGLVESEMFIQTGTSTMTAMTSKLMNIKNSYQAYATLGLEFVELSQNDDIVADQEMVQNLLTAFDELLLQVEQNMAELATQKAELKSDYETNNAGLISEKQAADIVTHQAQTAVNNATTRQNQLNTKSDQDDENLDTWQIFLVNEHQRCDFEESGYETRLDERADQLRILEAVILLFETRFVELNEYINSRVE